jgi:hypothetical protein
VGDRRRAQHGKPMGGGGPHLGPVSDMEALGVASFRTIWPDPRT